MLTPSTIAEIVLATIAGAASPSPATSSVEGGSSAMAPAPSASAGNAPKGSPFFGLGTTPSTPPGMGAAPSTPSGQLPLAAHSDYVISAMGIEQADLSLLAAILAFFDSPSLREEYENRVNAEGGGGRALLRILRVEHDNVPLGVCNATIAKIDLAFQ